MTCTGAVRPQVLSTALNRRLPREGLAGATPKYASKAKGSFSADYF